MYEIYKSISCIKCFCFFSLSINTFAYEAQESNLDRSEKRAQNPNKLLFSDIQNVLKVMGEKHVDAYCVVQRLLELLGDDSLASKKVKDIFLKFQKQLRLLI